MLSYYKLVNGDEERIDSPPFFVAFIPEEFRKTSQNVSHNTWNEFSP